jgi:hypothetical protein
MESRFLLNELMNEIADPWFMSLLSLPTIDLDFRSIHESFLNSENKRQIAKEISSKEISTICQAPKDLSSKDSPKAWHWSSLAGL